MNVVLIGFMGSGKTTIGNALAARKGLKFIDTDRMIETQNNISIKEIFENYGEAYFRQLEKQSIDQLMNINDCVIAVGGGAVMYHNNLDTLQRIGTTVFLDAPMKKLLTNLKAEYRPLVGNTVEESKLRELLNSRYSTYEKADIIINTESLDIEQTIDEVIKRLDL
jgi:shikimate kinase